MDGLPIDNSIVGRPQFYIEINRADEIVRWADPDVAEVRCSQAPGGGAKWFAIRQLHPRHQASDSDNSALGLTL
jgi:hypothetical protein